jgi:hypothetical protein
MYQKIAHYYNIYANIRTMKWSVIDKTRVKSEHTYTYSSLRYSSMHVLNKGNTPTIELDASSVWMN